MTRNRKLVLAAGAAALVLVAAAVGAFAVLRARRAAAAGRTADPAGAAQALTVTEVPEAALWIDVHAPAAAWKAVRESAWLKKAMAEPLGQGLSSGLAAFLGTRGTDLSGAFEGTVLDLVMGKLLADPFRIAYVAGADATGAPAFLVPRPSHAARAAFELLDRAAQHGRYQLAACPGAKGEAVNVTRWLIADHAVFAGERDGRIALAANPKAAAQALCLELPEPRAEKGVDLSVSVPREGLGHEANLAAELLGLSDVTTLQFAIEGTQLVPRGIAGNLESTRRLEVAAPREELLRVIPGDAGFVLLATLNLPEALDAGALRQHLDGKYQGKLSPRTVAVVWNPRPGEPEVAVAWPERDAKFLKAAFTGGPSKTFERRACGQVVLASTGALAGAMERACGGKVPSLLNGAPAVVAGLKQPVSLGVNVNVGQVLSRALGDAWAAEHGKGPGSPEIESARRLLEELPFIGLRGVTKGDTLEPGGFRS